MAYTIYKSNGQQLLTLFDGTMDVSRGINLVGKNYVNFGTAQNENFVWLMENFANGTPPAYPLTGQLWYDTSSATLKYFDGSSFNVLSNTSVLSTSVTALNTALVANVSNLSSFFSSNVTTLKANVATHDAQINSLWANAAIQASILNSLESTVTGSTVDISDLLDSTNARIDATNSGLNATNTAINAHSIQISNLQGGVNDLNNLVAAQAVVQSNQGASIGSLQTSLIATNGAITTANTAMKGYVDTNNLLQNNQITNLNSSVNTLNASFTSFYSWANLNFGTSNYTNADVALYLPSYTGNISAQNIYTSRGVFWSNGQPYASSNYSNVNTAAYLAGTVTTGNISTANGVFWANGAPYAPGGSPSRRTVTVTTANLVPGANASVTVAGFKGYALYSITSNAAAWVSIYSSVAARTADASRLQSVDPYPGSGVIAESIGSSQSFSPAVFGYSNETVPTTDIPIRVTNTGSVPAVITIGLTIVQTES